MISKCPTCLRPVSMPIGVEPTAEVICPLCDARFPLEAILDETPPQLIPVETTATADPAVSATTPAFMPEFASEIDGEREHGEDTADEPAFDFHPLGSENEPEESAADVAHRLRRSSSKKSIAREMISVFFGGIAGLAIAYYALNFFGGPRFDILSVYLPGCPHTYRHWPDTLLQDWLGDGESTSNDNAD